MYSGVPTLPNVLTIVVLCVPKRDLAEHSEGEWVNRLTRPPH